MDVAFSKPGFCRRFVKKQASNPCAQPASCYWQEDVLLVAISLARTFELQLIAAQFGRSRSIHLLWLLCLKDWAGGGEGEGRMNKKEKIKQKKH